MIIALAWISSFVKLWTADRVDRSSEGNAESLDLVAMVVDEVSTHVSYTHDTSRRHIEKGIRQLSPLFSVPHTAHIRMAFVSPEEASRRSPQSVQNTSDPMAAMITII